MFFLSFHFNVFLLYFNENYLLGNFILTKNNVLRTFFAVSSSRKSFSVQSHLIYQGPSGDPGRPRRRWIKSDPGIFFFFFFFFFFFGLVFDKAGIVGPFDRSFASLDFRFSTSECSGGWIKSDPGRLINYFTNLLFLSFYLLEQNRKESLI